MHIKNSSDHRLLLVISIIISVFVFWNAVFAAPTTMPTGFYYPTDSTTWTGKSGGETGDPKQPWNDKSTGGRIYGFLDSEAPRVIGVNHVGMDIRQAYNSPVYAIADGTITYYLNTDPSKYWCVIVKHRNESGDDFYAVYGHCRLKSGLQVGSNLAAGSVLGYVNEYSNQHLHFGIKMDSDFSTGWGTLDLNIDPESIGWRPPRTWLLSHSPFAGDATPPEISFAAPAPNTKYTTIQQINWEATDSDTGVAEVILQWDGSAPVTVDNSGTMVIPNGKHTVTISAKDVEGNESSTTGGPWTIAVPTMVVSVAPGKLAHGYFVQKTERTSAMYIEIGSLDPPDLKVGDLVAILSGVPATQNGLSILKNGKMIKMGSGTPPSPLTITAKELTAGPEHVGLLVTVTGRVSYRSSKAYFDVDDGSGAKDGSYAGIRVLCTGLANGSTLALPQLGQLVTVTGVALVPGLLGASVPSIQPRSQADIVALDRAAR